MLQERQSETEVVASILHGLNKMHIGFFWRNNNAGIYDKEKGFYRRPSKEFCMHGISDILGCYQGKMVAIEVKTPQSYRRLKSFFEEWRGSGAMGVVRPQSLKGEKKRFMDQWNFLREINRSGGLGFFTCSLEHTLEVLNANGSQVAARGNQSGSL